MDYKLEICTDSLISSLIAQEAGADRIELCTNLLEGGTTHSYGTIIAVREKMNIELNVIIRPRGGDFLYSEHELEIMKKDIRMCRDLCVDGIVLGILKPDGTIDTQRTSELIDLAYPLKVTFHRAFDMCSDPFKGLEDVISTGALRLLTSGQKNRAEEGQDLIGNLVSQAGNRLIIMPGGGISDDNIETIAKSTGATEFHMTGRKTIQSEMQFRREEIKMGGISSLSEYYQKVADQDLIKRVIHILNII
ncbi:MAG: copper homeostasis protein CutC [Methanosarcina sp.]